MPRSTTPRRSSAAAQETSWTYYNPALMPSIRLLTGDPASIDTDLLVLPVFEGEAATSVWQGLDAATAGEVTRAEGSGEIRGRLFDLFITPAGAAGWKARRVLLAGAGKPADFDTERLRKL